MNFEIGCLRYINTWVFKEETEKKKIGRKNKDNDFKIIQLKYQLFI